MEHRATLEGGRLVYQGYDLDSDGLVERTAEKGLDNLQSWPQKYVHCPLFQYLSDTAGETRHPNRKTGNSFHVTIALGTEDVKGKSRLTSVHGYLDGTVKYSVTGY